MAGMTSCSDKDIVITEDPVLDHDQSFFAYINIGDVNSITRGDSDDVGGTTTRTSNDVTKEPNFDAGNDKENAISSIYLIFYDEDSTRVATTQVMKNNNADGGTYDSNTTSHNSIYEGVVQIDIKHGSKPPRYVMCFVNPITSQNFEINPDFATLEALQKTKKPRIIDASDYFAMSKSVYYGVNRAKKDENGSPLEDKPENYEKIIATPIPDGSLFNNFNSAQAALNALNDNGKDYTINIYVERYAVKVNFSVTGKAKDNSLDLSKRENEDDEAVADDNENSTSTILKFVPEYWAVNAYEEETYVCKSFLSEDEKTNLTYQALNDSLGGSGTGNDIKMLWYWNSPLNHRSYWAQTPGYYKKAYPRVSDDLTDGVSYASEDYALGYYSYNTIKYNAENDGEWTYLSRKARKVGETDKEGKLMPIYARENTVAGSALKAAFADPLASPKAAVASVVMVGHYEVQDAGNSEFRELEDGEFFYIMGNATNGYTFFEGEDNMIKHFLNATIPFYHKYDDNSYAPIYTKGVTDHDFAKGMEERYKKYFTVKHPDAGARGDGFENKQDILVIDSRFVTIQLNADKIREANTSDDESFDNSLYVDLGDGFVKVTPENIDQVNQQMLYAAGTAQGYNGGKAYFSIPIKHLGFYRTGNPNADMSGRESNFNWNAVKSGDFGLVRNHIYTITVDEISGLGNAIPDPDDPIVPPTDPEEYYIGAKINVLNWAVVPDQSVKL